MALYKDGNPVSGLNSVPRLTLAQYNALNVKPEFWVRTDAPESYKKLSADQVSYDSNNTVKDKIDDYHDWQVVAQNVSTADISNTDFNEYNITVLVGGRTPAICYVFRLLRGSNLLSTNLKYIQGSWVNGNYGTAVEILANTSSISISSVYINGTNELTNAKMYVVGRY